MISPTKRLSTLLKEIDLKDVIEHIKFDIQIEKGKDGNHFSLRTYRLGVNIKQKDYLMLPTTLF